MNEKQLKPVIKITGFFILTGELQVSKSFCFKSGVSIKNNKISKPNNSYFNYNYNLLINNA